MLVQPPSAMKGDGRVMAHEYDRAADGSVCAVLDIREMKRAPVAEMTSRTSG
jgi:carotenoid cleavage dioxygenase-like enzyme